jgi:hypothetical protein
MRFAARRSSGLILALLLVVGTGRGQVSSPSEFQLKAAFLYHFAQFVEWPPGSFADTTSPIVIGVLGDTPLEADLEKTISGKTLNNRKLVAQQFRTAAEATNNCHMLFISRSEEKRLPEVMAVLSGARILTVGETPGFTESGGMINFVPRDGKIRFEINKGEADKAGFKLSSKLLSLASDIRKSKAR